MQKPEDKTLIEELLNLMHEYQADYTNTFRALTFNQLTDSDLFEVPEFTEWLELWHERLGRQEQSEEAIYQLMRDNNPAVIPRNHRVEAALEAAVEEEDFHVMKQLLNVLANPYAHTLEQANYATLPEAGGLYQTFVGT